MDEVPCLAVGAILGDSDAESMAWSRAIGSLSVEVRSLRKDVQSPLNVNVVFHVDGRLKRNGFEGVRTGRFDKKKAILVVQAALAKDDVKDRRAVLLPLLRGAIAEAERYAARKGLAVGLPEIRRLVERLGLADS